MSILPQTIHSNHSWSNEAWSHRPISCVITASSQCAISAWRFRPLPIGVFYNIWNAIPQTNPDTSGEVQLTDALNLFWQKHPLFGVHFEGQHYDAGHPIGYLKANLDIALQDPHLQGPLLHYVSDLQG